MIYIYIICIHIIIYIRTLDIDNEKVMIKIHDVTMHRCICIYIYTHMHLLPNLIHMYIYIHWVQDSFTYTSFITKVRFFAANPCYLHYISVYIYKSHQYPPGNKMSPSRAILSRWFSSSLLVGYVSSHQEGNKSLNIFSNSQRVPSYSRN